MLGQRVDSREWRAACDRAGYEVAEELPREMTTAGLAEEQKHGWRFQHGMLAESLGSRAEEEGRLQDHHGVCAGMLDELYPERRDEIAERRAEHLIGAGAYERALDPLLRAAQRYLHRHGDPVRATDLLERRRELMDACDLPDDDPRRAENLVEIAECAIIRGEPERARRSLRRAETIAEQQSWPEIEGQIHLLRARLAKDIGEFEKSLRHLDVAEKRHRRVGNERGLARTFRLRGQLGRKTMPRERTLEVLEEAQKLCERAGDAVGAMRCQKGIAWTWLESGEWEPAAEIAKELIADARSHRERILEAHAFNILAEIARRSEEWDRAIRLYERCQSLWEGAGSRYAVIAEVNTALAHAGAGRWERVEPIYGELEEKLPDRGFPNRLIHVHVGLAGCAAARSDWEQWERRIEELERMLDDHEIRLTDFAWMAERGAEACLEVDAPDRAVRMLELARRLWEEISHAENARRVDRRIEELGGSRTA